MEEFLGEILGLIFEALLEFLMGLAAAGLSHGLRRMALTTRRVGPLLSAGLIALAGVVAGSLSVWFVPVPIVRHVRFHGASLIVSPLVTGALLAYFGQGVRRRGRDSVAIESFGYGFVFALAMAVVRFVLVHGVGGN